MLSSEGICAEAPESLPLYFERGQINGETHFLPRVPVLGVRQQSVQYPRYECIARTYGTATRQG